MSKNDVTPAADAGQAKKLATQSINDSIYLPGGKVGYLLGHSLGGSPLELRFVAQSLARAGFTVSCPLIAGHGGTREALNSSKWTDWVSSLEEAHDKLRETCDFIIVGGLSAGGVMCLNLAAKRPASVHAVCLFAPTLYPDGWAIPWYFHLLNVFRHKWAMELFFLPEREPYGIKDERLRRFVIGALEAQPGGKERLSGFYGGTFIEFRWMVQAVRASLSSIKQPTLIVHPREDDRSSLRNAAYLQRRLGGIVETVVLNDSYHVCTLDRQRDVVVERALAFGERMRERSRGSQSQASNLQALRRR